MSQTGGRPGFPGVQDQQTPLSTGSPKFSLHAKKTGGGKFISHLLGLDHDESAQGTKIGTSAKPSPLKGMKPSELLQGVKFTPNALFFLLFFGFFMWLFVIYWVRHHEPLANQVLGTPKGDANKAAVDRRLVAGIKNAFPVQTSPSTGEVYVPGVVVDPSQMASPALSSLPQAPSINSAQYQQGTVLVPGASFGTSSTGMPASSIVPQAQVLQSQTAPQAVAPVQAGAAVMPAAAQGSYIVGEQTAAGTRVRTIVSR